MGRVLMRGLSDRQAAFFASAADVDAIMPRGDRRSSSLAQLTPQDVTSDYSRVSPAHRSVCCIARLIRGGNEVNIRRGLFLSLVTCSLAAGCSVRERDFGETAALLPDAASGSTMTGSDSGVGRAAGTIAVGLPCTEASECQSGACVDGVCCQSACDAVCTRCDAAGREGECTVSASDPACNASCPESSECRTYGSGTQSANCEAVGVCRAAIGCTYSDAPSGTPCQNGVGTCDGAGECIVPGTRRLGESCTVDGECGEGHCVLGTGGGSICCDSACDGVCRACDVSGRCDDAPIHDARCAPVDCPDDDVCRDFPEDITTNLCRAYGTCRNNADCTPTEIRLGAECSCGVGGCSLALGLHVRRAPSVQREAASRRRYKAG